MHKRRWTQAGFAWNRHVDIQRSVIEQLALRSAWSLAALLILLSIGCARWLPVAPNDFSPGEGEAGRAANGGTKGVVKNELASDTVGIETILLRLSALEGRELPDLWAGADEQVFSPALRMAFDRNGLRVGKFRGVLPALAQRWIAENAERIATDPMEQAGVVADVSSFTQLWRCRASQSKELTIRNLPQDSVTLFYNEDGVKGGMYHAPHFMMMLQAFPLGDGSARVQLVPQLEHGQARRVVVAKESAIRTDERRDSILWKGLGLDVQLQLGDCLVLGASSEPHGLGEHYFRTRTRSNEVQDVILLVRVSELHAPDVFARKP